MPPVTGLDAKKLRARRIVATAALTAVAVAFLLLSTRKAPVSAASPAAGPSHQAVDKQVPSDPVAEQTPAVQTAMELEPSPAANPSPPGSEQRLYKSRRALETVDPREFLRHASVAR
jgi:hypothetical protein